MTESEIIDEILSFRGGGTKAVPVGVSSEEYEEAFEEAIELGLINHLTRIHYVLTSEGKRAVKLGGVDKWRAFKEKHEARNSGRSNIINFHAPITGSVVNQDSSLRDLNNQSPTIKNDPQQNQPKQKAANTSHTFWDKAKYISVIVGGVSAVLVGLAKVFGWW